MSVQSKCSRRPGRYNRRKGGLVLELAMVLPIFLGLILAVFEISTVLFVRHAMLNAARDGARSYAINEFDSAGAIGLARTRLSSMSINFTVTAIPDDDSGLDRWVQVSTPMSEAAIGDPLGLFSDGDLIVRVTMRREE